MKVLTDKLGDYIRFFGYTSQGVNGTPETNFFEIQGQTDDMFSADQTQRELNGYRRLNAYVLAQCGSPFKRRLTMLDGQTKAGALKPYSVNKEKKQLEVPELPFDMSRKMSYR